MSFGNIGKKFAEQRSQQSGKQSDDSALFTYSHDTQPKRKDTGQSVKFQKAFLEELKVELIISGNTCVSPRKTSRINAVTKAIRKRLSNVVQNHIASFISNNSDKVVNLFVFELEKDSILLFFYFQSLFEHDSKIV